ncbi:ABC transporter substrate-binding protein [Mesotoga sp.]|uniref:ABC transporter substrate-binding protein n=1 Tax=Mesotoga sp. TaxID=2053577 RepID=UPI0026227924|nr:ABC transporter substrate-binding protein [Mesotoga sp.]MDD4208263.1 ABC transporter substrate-binding protein [Mesotoga sp.]
MKKLALVIVALMVFSFAFSTPEYVIEDFDGKPGGTLNLQMNLDPATFNPLIASEIYSGKVIGLFSSSLLGFDTNRNLTIPELASDWWLSEDGLTVFFKIREGILWSDGEPFTVDDVYWRFSLLVETGVSGFLDAEGNLPIIELIDDSAISLTWTVPNTLGIKVAASREILPKHVFEPAIAAGTVNEIWSLDEVDQIVGMGPFIPSEYVPGARVVLKKNPNYWKLDSNGVRLPYLDSVVIHIMSGSNPMWAFQAGNLDFFSPSTSQLKTLLSQKGHNWVAGQGGSRDYVQFLLLNFNAPDPIKREWFRNDHFRRGFAYLIDREKIIDTTYGGNSKPLYSPLNVESPYYARKVEEDPFFFSVEKAKSEFELGGFSWNSEGKLIDGAGNTVVLDLEVSPDFVSLGNLIVSNAKNLGITINLVRLVGVPLMEEPLYDSFLSGLFNGTIDPELRTGVFRIDGPGHYWNYPPGYRDYITEEMYYLPEWEKRIHEIFVLQTSATEDERYELFEEFQILFTQYQPIIYIHSPNLLYAYQGNVHFPNPIPSAAADELWKAWGIWKE